MQVSPGRNYATGSYDYAMSIFSGSFLASCMQNSWLSTITKFRR